MLKFVVKIWIILLIFPLVISAQRKYQQPGNDKSSGIFLKKADLQFNKRKFDAALINYKKALKSFEFIYPEDDLYLLNIKKQIANSYMNLGKYDSALFYINNTLRYIQINDTSYRRLVADVFYIKGHLSYVLNQPDSSEFYLTRSLDFCDTLRNDSLYVHILKDYGNLWYSKYDFISAKSYYEKALKIENSRIRNSEIIKSSIYQNLAIIYANIVEYDSAKKYFKKAIRLKEKYLSEEDKLLLNIYMNYSVFLNQTGAPKKALEYLNIIEARISGNSYYERFLLGNLYLAKATVFLDNAQYSQCLYYVEKSLNIFTELLNPDHEIFGRIHETFGVIYYNLHKYDHALTHLYKALDFTMKPSLKFNIYSIITSCFLKINDLLQAEKMLKLALKNDKDIYAQNHLMGYLYSYYGDLLLKKTKYDSAYIMYNKSLAIATRNFGINGTRTIQALNKIGRYYNQKGDYSNALHFYQKSLNALYPGFNESSIYSFPEIEKTDLLYSAYETFEYRAHAFYNRYKYKTKDIQDLYASNQNSKTSLKLQNIIIQSSFDNISRYKMIEESARLCDISIVTDFELLKSTGDEKYLENIVSTIETGKSTALLYQINNSSAINIRSIPEGVAELERSLKGNLSFCNQKIELLEQEKDNFTPEKLNYFRSLRFFYVQQYDSLINYLESQFPEYYSLKYSTKTPTVKDIQQTLDSNSVLLNYALLDTMIIAAIIDMDTIYISKSKIPDSFRQKVVNYFIDIKKGGDKAQFIKNSHYLYKKLIDPFINYFNNKNKLIIIPDDYLIYVPFETLVSKKPDNIKAISFGELDFLIKKFEISSNYSSTLWLNSHNSDPAGFHDGQLSFAGFAPVFDNKNNAIPDDNYFINDTSIAQSDLRSITIDGKTYNKLPFSEKEVHDIYDLFVTNEMNARIFLHSEANEESIKTKSKDYSIIHIATHGISNDKNPSLSGLILSPTEASIDPYEFNIPANNFSEFELLSKTNDGILYSSEMYNLDLNADLVVLSACETGIGKIIKGEGMVSMTRGLVYSGVPNIVYTLWKISDKHTHLLMNEFYKYVISGNSYSASLHKAKLHMLQSDQTSYPKLWSGFILNGR